MRLVGARRSGYTVGLAAVAVAVLVLSTGSSIVKFSETSGTVVAFWRLWCSAVVWQVVCVVRRSPLPWAAVRATAPAGAMFGVNIVTFFTAVGLTRVANAEFIGTLTPVLLVPFGALMLHERVRRNVVLAGAVALVGVAIILFEAPRSAAGNNWRGNALAIVSVFTWCGYLILARRVRARISTMHFMAAMNLAAAIVVTPYALARTDVLDVGTRGWACILVMTALNGLIAHGLIAWSQNKVPLSTMSLMQLSQPGMSVLWAYLLVGESIRPVQLVGMALVVCAVAVIARDATRGATPEAAVATSPSDGEPPVEAAASALA
jgi:drug/metabolite transporter (DMT)-like permease